MKKSWLFIPILFFWFFYQKESSESIFPVRDEKSVEVLPVKAIKQTGAKFETIEQLKIQEHHEVQRESFDSPLGKTIVYSFSQGGIPILGMAIRMRQESNGTLVEEENTYRPIPPIPVNRQVLEEQANLIKENSSRYDLSSLSPESLVILVREGIDGGELAFTATSTDKLRSNHPVQVVVRADDGKILRKSFSRKEF
ncbi:hypothetical protein EBT16_06615 [bacterium]|nr:hypothetical protein [bacterium]